MVLQSIPLAIILWSSTGLITNLLVGHAQPEILKFHSDMNALHQEITFVQI